MRAYVDVAPGCGSGWEDPLDHSIEYASISDAFAVARESDRRVLVVPGVGTWGAWGIYPGHAGRTRLGAPWSPEERARVIREVNAALAVRPPEAA